MSVSHLTTRDVSLIVGFTPKTIREWCARGVFPGAKKFPDESPRSEWRIPAGAVETLKRDRIMTQPPSRDRLDELMTAALNKPRTGEHN